MPPPVPRQPAPPAGFAPVGQTPPPIPAPRPGEAQRPGEAPRSGEPPRAGDWARSWPSEPPTPAGWNPESWADPPPASSYYAEIDSATATTLSFSMDPLNAPLPQPGPPPDRPWTAYGLPVDPPDVHRHTPPPPRDPLTDPLRHGGGSPDGDLLIFAETPKSPWFTLPDDIDIEDDTPDWTRLNDDGWRVAEQVSHPAVGADTHAGLPRRVPQANLVPGSAQADEPQVPIVRDAESIAAHTSGYFRGWRRGQEIGGYAVGQRDRAAWEFNRDRARDGLDQPARMAR
jgi:hypothetical protein